MLKDSVTYGPWRTKLSVILDAEDSLEIVNGTELEPVEIAKVLNPDNTSANSVEVARDTRRSRTGEKGLKRQRP